MYKKEAQFITEDIKVNVEILELIKNSYNSHKSIELIYVIDGVLEVDKVEHKYILEKGDLYIINSEDIHKLETIGKDNIILIAHINEELIKELYDGLYGDIFRCRYIKSICHQDYLCNNDYLKEKSEVVQAVKDYLLRIYTINNLYKESLNNEVKSEILYHYKVSCNYYYKNIISLLINEFGAIECFKKLGDLDDEMSKRYNIFIKYISENYNEKITLDKI